MSRAQASGARSQHAGYWTSWQMWQRQESPEALTNLALRTKSPIAIDALALAASGGTALTTDLVSRAAEYRLPPERTRSVAAFALALAGMARSTQEVLAATVLYERVWSSGHGARLGVVHHQGFAQALSLTRRDDLLETVIDELTLPAPVRHDLTVDLANPYLPDRSGLGHGQWQSLLGKVFTDAGLEEPAVTRLEERPQAHLFDLLTAPQELAGTWTKGPLVSVIMPCYRPDEGLLTSIASITGQSWADLEIIVVDDASGPEFDEVFQRAVASDPRARLLRMPSNGGSYLTRNAAIGEAKGEFVTFQDADDWSHPRRIEHQASLLLVDPGAPASRSAAVRAKDDLTHQWFGYRSLRDNASSLMVRRSAYDQLGAFAPIRKGADSEYAERIETRIGTVRDTGTPLAITRLRTGTLSRGDFTYQWASPERLAFKGAYRAWHRQLAAGASAVTPDVTSRLPFPVPRSFTRGLEVGHHPERLSFALAADFSEPPADRPLLAQRISEEAGSGTGPIGLWHLESAVPVRTKRAEMHDEWFDRMLADPRLHPVTRTDPILIDRLLVLDPRVLLCATAQPCALRASRVVVALTPEALEPDTSGLPLDLLSVSDACLAWWGVRPQWVAAAGLDPDEQQHVADLVGDLITRR